MAPLSARGKDSLLSLLSPQKNDSQGVDVWAAKHSTVSLFGLETQIQVGSKPQGGKRAGAGTLPPLHQQSTLAEGGDIGWEP